MERSLAHVEVVKDIRPIEGADRIEYITVLGWHVIQAKDTVNVGQKVVYIEIDSKVPEDNEAFDFLARRDYKVKSMKMRGVISQGLIMTFDSLGLDPDKFEIGQDVTELLKITKIQNKEEMALKKAEASDFNAALSSIKARHRKFFSNAFVKKMMRKRWFKILVFKVLGRKKDKPSAYPTFITKTDETRIENMPFVLGQDTKYIATEKIDGTSSTFAVRCTKKCRNPQKNKYEFIVCSRNVRQATMDQECFHTCGNVYWEMALKYDIENVLTDIARKNNQEVVILQGETIGSVQGNPYKLEENDFYGYNLIFTDAQKSFYDRFNSIEAAKIVAPYGIKWVPILDEEFVCPDTIEEMKELAEGKSKINPKVKREGVVYRSYDATVSFKNVSNSYLLKHND